MCKYIFYTVDTKTINPTYLCSNNKSNDDSHFYISKIESTIPVDPGNLRDG